MAGYLIDLVSEQDLLVLADPREGVAFGRHAARVDRASKSKGCGYCENTTFDLAAGDPIVRSEAADRVERLQREPGRVDFAVATRAFPAVAVRVQLLPDRLRPARVGLEVTDPRRRWRRRPSSRLASTKLRAAPGTSSFRSL